MILAAFRSEWVKLRRRNLLIGSYVGVALAASLFAVLLFAQAPASGNGGGLPSLSAARPTERADPRREQGGRASRHRGLWDRCHADRQ